jgi:hypothetical protein
MTLRSLATGIAAILCLYAPARGAMYKIDNPAANIYNPATRMDNPNPLSPPTQPVPQPVPQPVSQPTVTEVTTTTEPAKQIKEQPRPKPTVPQKRYYFKTASMYIVAAKKAFARDDYMKFISITEDALRRINAGTLKASKKTKLTLARYKVFGYDLLEKNGD